MSFDSQPAAASKNWFSLVVIAISIWLMIVVTFTMPGRHSTGDTSEVDFMALVKIAARIGSLGLLLLLALQMKPRQFADVLKHGFWPFVALSVWGVISSGWSARGSLSLAQAGCFGVLVLLGMLIAYRCRTIDDISFVVLHTSMALFTVSAIIVAVQKLTPDWGVMGRNAAGDGAEGILHPTTAASTASLGILLLLAARLGWKNWSWARWAFWPVFIVHCVVLYWSAARLALALTVAAAVIMLFAFAPRKHLKAGVFVAAAAGVLLMVVNPDFRVFESSGDTIVDYLRRGQTSSQLAGFSGREELWPIMWESFWDSPIRGHGFYVTTAKGSFKVWNDRGNLTAHNFLLQSMTTLGLVGLVLLIASLVAPITGFLRSRFESIDSKPLFVVLPVVWAWYFGWGMLNVSFMAPFQPESVVFFIAMGLAVGWTLIARREQPALASAGVENRAFTPEGAPQ